MTLLILLWNLRRIHLDGSGSPRNAKGGLRTEPRAFYVTQLQ